MSIINTETPRLRTQKGATIIEYVLIAALLSIASFAVLATLGTKVSDKFGSVSASL